MNPPPSSLRDLYIDPNQAWAFVPPIVNGTTGTAASSSSAAADLAPPPHSFQFSTRPSHNSIYDLSPGLADMEPSGANAARLFKAFVASAVLEYTSSAIVMPWEVGRTLLQVQWVPRDAGEVDEEEEEGQEGAQGIVEEDAVSFFIVLDTKLSLPSSHVSDVWGRRSIAK